MNFTLYNRLFDKIHHSPGVVEDIIFHWKNELWRYKKICFFRSKHPAIFAELQLQEKGTTSAAVEESVPPHLVERTKKLGIGR